MACLGKILFVLLLTFGLGNSVPYRSLLRELEQANGELEDDCTGRDTLEEYADYFELQLRTQTLPFWYGKLDEDNGGFDLDKDGKHIVAQSRIIWLFSYTHMKGFNAEGIDSLKAAKWGFDFVSSKMRDPVNGGYYWSVDKEGNVQDNRKMMYGQSFVIYAFTTYFKASGDPRAKELAMDLFRTLVDNTQDMTTGLGGWFDHFTADWKVIDGDEEIPIVEPGLKTQNFIMHFMESLTDLLLVTGHPEVRRILAQIVDKDVRLFYPADPNDIISQVDFDGKSVGPLDLYAHALESAWLRIEAEFALGRSLDWGNFDRYMRKMIEKGIDAESGGIFDKEELVWWAQAEVISAVAVDKALRDGNEYEPVLLKLLRFVECDIVDPKDGIWWWSVNSDGSIRNDQKFGKWKAGFHDIRGMVKFIRAYKPSSE